MSLKVPVEDDAHLYLWTTNQFIPAAFDVARAWGFRPITLIYWVKTTEEPIRVVCPECIDVMRYAGEDEETIKKLAYRPLPTGVVRASPSVGYYFRSAVEPCLFGVRGRQERFKEALPTAFLWPRQPHSVKPEAFYDLVERVSPAPYLELFARRNRIGWETWGNECLPQVEISAVSTEERGEAVDATA